ncbi:MAG: asparagine synthase (glutamine-hydrolyzing) [Fluviibacter sp.]
MCGITGFITKPGHPDALLEPIARTMADRLVHRGPDDAGVWADAGAGVALGHRRLAIVDLSAAGHQPMASACGRYVIAFNGEIYNHLDLRKELGGIAWRGHSDTETLLAGIAAWGLEATLERCVGMFAVALWDRQTQTLLLARDRFGEKPLYYGWVGQGADRAFAFASELKALRAYPGFDNPISRKALGAYLQFMCVPAPLSIYEDIYKLEPGCILTLSAPLSAGTQPVIEPYWLLRSVVEAGRDNLIVDEATAIAELEARLSDAVRLQSLADVPLGAFLSGGVDSSTIVALMQAQASRPVKTFTVGFDEAGFDESPHAKAVARHLGTEHHELFVTAVQAREVITNLPAMYDEPFADSSQIPTYLVSQATRRQVTVALSGDAGDELFGGYNRYFWGPRIWNRLSWLPYSLRRTLGGAIRAMSVANSDALSRVAGVSRLGDKAHKLATRLNTVQNMDDLYWSLVTEWPDPTQLVKGLPIVVPCFGADEALPSGLDSVERMMFRDTLTYLPDDILCKVDRAAMAVSLETRVPFLDHRVAELAWRLPQTMKIRGNTSKWALRQVLYKYVPRELIERPKAGFAIPIGEWLRGPLREWAEALLDAKRLAQEGYFNSGPIREAWQQHLSGKHDRTARLWSVLMFQAWLEANH